MDIERQSLLLQEIYRLYDEFIEPYDLACRKGCAPCCTCNVTMTTLEGLLIQRHLDQYGPPGWVVRLLSAQSRPRYQPATTINQLAVLCARDEAVPDDFADPQDGPCAWLSHSACPLYAVRPFGCRAMVSKTDCAATGVADMPEFVLTANNLFSQYIEAIDDQGLTGNLVDILLFLSDPRQRRCYEARQSLAAPQTLLTNRPAPVLMIPPEHRQRIGPLLQAIQQAVRNALGSGRPADELADAP